MKSDKIRLYDVCIVGGGASGLFCAASLKKNNPQINVAVIEKQKDIGKKLLATGNGRCNLTNLNADISMYHGTFKNAAENMLNICPPELLIGLFRDFGLLTTNDSEGRVYPYSKHSASVLDTLRINCANRGVEIICECCINELSKVKDEFILKDKTDRVFKCKSLIISCGSKATPETGADDTLLHKAAKVFNHSITPLFPSLCPVTVKSKSLHFLKGVRANGAASIFVDSKEAKTEYGEIQFTDKALSGICLFNLSRIANTENNAFVRLSLLPDKNDYEIFQMLTERAASVYKESTAENLFTGIFQKKLSLALLHETGIDKDSRISSLSKDKLRSLTELINHWDFPVIPSSDFTRAQVVAGGIKGDEIDPLTMESKKVRNLYFIGEATDCDGDCGGLNLHFAFASAYCAAGELKK